MKITFNPKDNVWNIKLDYKELMYCICGKDNIYDAKAEWLKRMSRLFDDKINNKFLY